MIKPIQSITAYETADGQVFDTLEAAQCWQETLAFKDYYRRGNELWSGEIPETGEVVEFDTIAAWLIDNRAAVADFLNSQQVA